VDELIGRGVHYGSAPTEALRYRGCDVAVIGSANSAGQAALHLAQHSRKVMLLVRGASLESMSRYLVDRIHACPSIHVLVNSRVVDAAGADRLEALVVADSVAQTQARLEVDALFVLIGGVPLTAGVAGWLCRDQNGFLITGRELLERDERARWPLERDPFPLESSQPGVFVAGDVRHGSIKRVASAVGDGAMAVQLIHEYLSNPHAPVAGQRRPPGQNVLNLAERPKRT
jgi:thioredoxin reductase (NADPH)